MMGEPDDFTAIEIIEWLVGDECQHGEFAQKSTRHLMLSSG